VGVNLTFQESTVKTNFELRKKWRATTALCIVSTLAVGTAAYAADLGRSSWDKRTHSHAGTQNLSDHDGDKGNHASDKTKTATPIKHVIILIGENRGLDHTFGVYKPKGAGQTISNLLSKGIVNEDGTPGPNFAQAQQFSVAGQPSYYIGAPAIAKAPYSATNGMPQPNTNGAPMAQSDTGAPFKTIAEAGVEKDMNPADLDILTTGFTGLPTGNLDTRVPGAGTLAGPFPLQGPNLTDDDSATPRIASTRTGSKRTAASPTPPRTIPPAARPICSRL
jgi:phospholipase C